MGRLDNVRTILTERLSLVPVTPANAGILWKLIQEPDLRDYQDLPDVDRAQFLRVVGNRPTRLTAGAVGRFEWLVHYTGKADPLGWVSLRVPEADRAAAEIGYSIVRAHRGQGIATEAVAALIEEGFQRAGLREVRAYCLPENLSSRAVLSKNGFENTGTLTRGATLQGRPVDVLLHSLGRSRWEERITANRPATRS